MESLKIGEITMRSGKSPAPAQMAAQTATFGTEMKTVEPAHGLMGGMPGLSPTQLSGTIAAQLTAPPAINVSLLSSASTGYGSARAAFGVEAD